MFQNAIQILARIVVCLAIGLIFPSAGSLSAQTVYLSENFESLSLQDSFSPTEKIQPAVWTSVPPAGWTVDNSGVPAGGVPEFTGWTFVQKDWWHATAGQNRNRFTDAANIIAVADGDEWDDSGPGARMTTRLISPMMVISGAEAGTLRLKFHSSWRSEPQTAWVKIAFDGGDWTEILHYDSNTPTKYSETLVLPLNNPAGASTVAVEFGYEAGNNWWWAIDNVEVGVAPMVVSKAGAEIALDEGDPTKASDTIEVGMLYNPGTPVVVTLNPGNSVSDFILSGQGAAGENGIRVLTFDATNWNQSQVVSVNLLDDEIHEDTETYSIQFSVASDNPAFHAYAIQPITVTVSDDDLPGTVIFAENFDQLVLGPNVEERNTTGKTQVWTKIPPMGWELDDRGMPGAGDPSRDGVTEWAGWSFADWDFWVQSDFQDRQTFTRASGVVAVADPDEWDDRFHQPDPGQDPWYDTFLSLPIIPLLNMEPSTLVMKFDSSWNPEYDDDYHQTGNVTANYDNGSVELIRWESNSQSPAFKPYATNETVVTPIPNQAGHKYMTLTFGLFDAGNDWWWAIDNLKMAAQVNAVKEWVQISKAGQTLHLFEESTTSMNSDQFEVVLTVAPTSDVTLTVDPAGVAQDVQLSSPAGTPNSDGTLLLTFTPDNWDKPQIVTVIAVDDSLSEGREKGPIVFGTDSIGDARFTKGYVADYILVRLYDNEVGDVVLFETDGSTQVREGQGEDTYRIVLSRIPTASVQMQLEDLSDPNQVLINGQSIQLLTFSPTDVPSKVVSITAVNDSLIETDPHLARISHALDSEDLAYADLDGGILTVAILETRCGAWGFDMADLNQDCFVNLADMMLLVDQWMDCTVPYSPGCIDNR